MWKNKLVGKIRNNYHTSVDYLKKNHLITSIGVGITVGAIVSVLGLNDGKKEQDPKNNQNIPSPKIEEVLEPTILKKNQKKDNDPKLEGLLYTPTNKTKDPWNYFNHKNKKTKTKKTTKIHSKVYEKFSLKQQLKTARWLAKKYPKGNIDLPKPITNPTHNYGFTEMTNYFTSDCKDYKCWSGLEAACNSTRKACDSHRRDVFCGGVRMEGSGICDCDGNLKAYSHNDFNSKGTKTKNKCDGGEIVDKDYRGTAATGTSIFEHRTIAVNPKFIPYGSLVFVDWPNVPNDPDRKGKAQEMFGGWYIAEDTGGAFKKLPKIDVYTGVGHEARDLGMRVITRRFPKCVKAGRCNVGTDAAKVKYGPAVWVIPPEEVKDYLMHHNVL